MDELIMMIDPAAIDRAASAAFNAQTLPGMTPFFAAVTLLGDANAWMAALAGYLVLGKEKLIAVALLIVLVFSGLINEDIKDITMRSRPEGATSGNYFNYQQYSFPSGHTQTAFAIAAVLSGFIALRYSVITFLLAAMVGLSRVYLGVHFLTDVIAGALVGFTIGMLALLALYTYGLHKSGGILGFASNALRAGPVANPPDRRTLKVAGFVIVAGFFCSLVTLMLSWYAASLAAIAAMYMLLLLVPALIQGSSQQNRAGQS
jgi:undecaprenyl-diphosphatase